MKVEKDVLKKEDAAKFEEKGADFDVAFTAADAGKKTVDYELKFAVCKGKEACKPVSEKGTISVDVK